MKTITEMTITEVIFNNVVASGTDAYIMATNSKEIDRSIDVAKMYRDAEKENSDRAWSGDVFNSCDETIADIADQFVSLHSKKIQEHVKAKYFDNESYCRAVWPDLYWTEIERDGVEFHHEIHSSESHNGNAVLFTIENSVFEEIC